MTSAWLGDLTWPDLEGGQPILAVPLGSTEQHGPHLPLSTDTDIADVLCARLAAARDDVVIAPAMPYGSSGEHAGFPGTLSIGQEVLELVVIELARSAASSFAGVVFVSGHGGNAETLDRAVRRLREEGHDVMAFRPRWEGDAHAGRSETAMMLATRPGAVRAEAATSGNTTAVAELLPQMREAGVRAVSPNGVLGDPTGATANEGAALLDALADQLITDVAGWHS